MFSERFPAISAAQPDADVAATSQKMFHELSSRSVLIKIQIGRFISDLCIGDTTSISMQTGLCGGLLECYAAAEYIMATVGCGLLISSRPCASPDKIAEPAASE